MTDPGTCDILTTSRDDGDPSGLRQGEGVIDPPGWHIRLWRVGSTAYRVDTMDPWGAVVAGAIVNYW